MLDAPFYLAIGSFVLEAGEGAGPFYVRSMSFPEPEPDGYGGFNPAVRTITGVMKCATIDELNANVAALRRQAVRDKRLRFRPRGTGDVLECRVREARVTEDVFDPLERALESAPKVSLTIVVATDPHWLGPWSADVVVNAATVPGHFDVADVPGQDDALVRIRAIFADQGTMAAIAVKPEPGPGYDHLDDYSGSADANALGSAVRDEALYAATGDFAAVGTAPEIDTNDNRGRHLTLARMGTNGTPAAMIVRAVTSTTGSAIAASVSVPEDERALSSADLIGYELGDIQIPAGQVPDVQTGSGWQAETVKASQATDDGTLTLSSQVGELGLHEVRLEQTFPAFDGRMTAFEYTIDTAPSTALFTSSLALVDSGGLGNSTWNVPTTVGTHKVPMPSPVSIVSGGSGKATLILRASAAFTVGFAFGSNRYASGALTSPYGTGGDADDDLVFKVYGQIKTGFATTVAVQAKTSEASPVLNLDYVQRIPLDFAALVMRLESAGTLALFYDGDTDTPYAADADGIGPAMYDKCEIRRPLRFRPGVVNRVVLGCLQADEPIGGATVTYAYRPRYLTAAG